MKIAILADGYPSKGNPQFIFVQQLVNALVDLGNEIFVIAPQSLTHALIRGEKILSRHTVEYTKKFLSSISSISHKFRKRKKITL